MSLSEISSGGQTSICKISTGGSNIRTKNKLRGTNVQVAFSTGGQMSINRFINWEWVGGANVRWGGGEGEHMSWTCLFILICH